MRVKTQERRDMIIETAAQLFQEVGYENASMQELSKRMGGSKATLYNYFTSKEELFGAVVRSYATGYLSDAADNLFKPDDQHISLEEKLTLFGERMLQVLTNEGKALAIYRMVIGESGRSDIGQLFHEAGPKQSGLKLAEVMQSAMDNQEIRKDNPYLKALQFLALVTAEVNNRYFYKELQPIAPEQIKEMVARAVRMFFIGAKEN